ncbi:MAG: T9SS type A sorting domain-containing protein [Bacteroidetes bacterium]|nr:T9SS type A sorting domain-containing protein [Bacteroidota bacterium]
MLKRIQFITFIFTFLILANSFLFPQERESFKEPVKHSIRNGMTSGNSSSKFFVPLETKTGFKTTVYTFGDITIFSYFDNTIVTIYDQSNAVQGTATLTADTLYTLHLSSGIYRIEGNKTYTVLIGDAISSTVQGYFAVDEGGRGVSTRLNTWMMGSFREYDDFIIFAYNDNTGFTVRNLETGNLIFAGTLNKGQHYSFREAGTIPYSTPLQVTGTQPVSALSYTDQDYYVPSANGTFTGTLFYGYSAYNGSWANSITITSYADNNNVQIVNSATGETIKTVTLQRSQVYTETITAPTYWTVTSTYAVSAANIPYYSFSSGYYYLARSIDETGKGFGKLFYVPTIGSRIDVFSFDPSNKVTITQLGTYDQFPYSSPTQIWTGTLNEGEEYNFYSQTGSYVYKIEATGYVSVVQSNGGAGADFMPLAYSLDYPDLAISSNDIVFSKADSLLSAGDKISITVTVHNYGSVTANNVSCVAYEGDPDAGGSAPPVGSGAISSIPVNGSGTFSFNYTVPPNPQFRSIVVKIDPNNEITESNKSNNKAQKTLKPNTDLLPPLAVTVTAPSSLQLVNGQLSPNPFTARFDIFNTGTVSSDNVIVTLELQNGLTLSSGSLVVNLGSIAGNASKNIEYKISANPNISGFNFYKVTVTSSNANPKIVSRAINIPDAVAPAKPSNFKGDVVNGSIAGLSWGANTEADLAGYYLYYSADGVNWNGTGAVEGGSPILVLNANSFPVTGLPISNPSGTPYWFKLKAFDSSNNLSDETNVINLQLTSQTSTQVLFYGDDPFIYTINNGTGYVTGPNSYKDIGKYQRFDISGQKTLKEVRFYFGAKEVNGSAENFNIVVRGMNATGAPGNLLYTLTTNTDGIDISQPSVKYNTYSISPQINVNGPFFVGAEWDSTINDNFAIICDSSGEGNTAKRAWEKWNDGTYHDIQTAWQNLDIDLWITAVFSSATGTEEEVLLPTNFRLSQNYPNPFNPSTTIKYSLPKASYVTLKVYDLLGNEINTLVKGEKSAGVYSVAFDGHNLSSGTYFYRLQVFDSQNPTRGTYSETKKFVLLK